jgi:hypothetical protein
MDRIERIQKGVNRAVGAELARQQAMQRTESKKPDAKETCALPAQFVATVCGIKIDQK